MSQVKQSQLKQKIIVNRTQSVCCPNCGSSAERHYLPDYQFIRTQCRHCDYLLVTTEAGRVIEAYAPGLSAVG